MMRVIARLNVGGPALHVAYLSHGLEAFGYETLLVAGRVGHGEGSMEYAAREQGVDPHFIEELGREISPSQDAHATLALRDLIARTRPHILHTHTAKAGAIGRAAALLAGRYRPHVIVHTFHGHVLRSYFGRSATAGFRRVEQVLARTSDALIAVSPQVRRDLVALGVAEESKIAVIRLGLDLERRLATSPGARERLRHELGIEPADVNVAWFGRMTEIKRVDDLLASFAHATRESSGAVLTLVGDGPLRAGLEAHARDLGIADRCRFLGYREDVAPLYAAADVVALTSANEGTPVSLIEALAASKPVLSTAVGGVADVVDDGTTGFLVRPDEPELFTRRLRQLVEDEELRARLGRNGRGRTLERYAVPRLLGDVDALYRSLLEEREPNLRRTFGPVGRPLPSVLEDRPRRRTSSPLRVVLVSQYFPPEVGATQTRMQAFAEHLAARGHEVTVVCEVPNHPHGIVPPEYRGRFYVDDRSNPYRVLRVWVEASEVKTQRTRMTFYLSYMLAGTAMAPVVGRADVVFATSPPLFAGLTGLGLARLLRARFVLDVRDLWPAAAVSLRQIPSPWAVRAGEWLERLLYRQADAVTAVTRPFCDHIDRIATGGGGPRRAVFLPNGTLDLFVEAGLNGERDRLAVPDDRFLVTFAGTHGIAQSLPTVLTAAGLVGDWATFAFVGDGPVKDHLVAKAQAIGLTNVAFHPERPLEEIPPVLAGSDALLVPLSAHRTFRDFVPSKLLDFMAVGRPVVLSGAGESARVLERAGAGIAVAPEDPAALADAVRWLRDNPHAAGEMGEKGRAFARGRLRRAQAERLECLLEDVAAR